jgi:hypothetical protein
MMFLPFLFGRQRNAEMIELKIELPQPARA